jgi:hypothetical protein
VPKINCGSRTNWTGVATDDSPFIEAIVTQTRYSMSILPGCEGPHLRFERRVWRGGVFAYVNHVHCTAVLKPLYIPFWEGRDAKVYRLRYYAQYVPSFSLYAYHVFLGQPNNVVPTLLAISPPDFGQTPAFLRPYHRSALVDSKRRHTDTLDTSRLPVNCIVNPALESLVQITLRSCPRNNTVFYPRYCLHYHR